MLIIFDSNKLEKKNSQGFERNMMMMRKLLTDSLDIYIMPPKGTKSPRTKSPRTKSPKNVKGGGGASTWEASLTTTSVNEVRISKIFILDLNFDSIQ